MAAFLLLHTAAASAAAALACSQPVYLTIDTGHMGVAPLVAEVLQRQQVKATFFLAAEPTLDGGHALDERWAPWWRARAAEGHAFGSHTWSHASWRADLPDGRLRLRDRTVDAAGYCAELQRPAERFRALTGQDLLPLFRAPAGRTSPALLAAAHGCGWRHVGWTPAGFLGDELDSARHPNDALLRRALATVKAGDILLMHLGTRDRRDPWAPGVLEPLLQGLKAKGLCFATLREHPRYGSDLP